MKDYIFTLKYRLSEQGADQQALLERLGAAGCDDALVGIGMPGRLALAFTREAPSAESALFSALADVRRAIPDAELIEAGPDFVGLTDVADAVGVTRQNMRKLMLAHPSTFPVPVHEGSASVWHLADVMTWLQSRGTYTIAQAALDVARAAKQINLAKQARHMLPSLRQQLSSFVD